ncbi:hypothetical protein BGZ83_010077 [Gryganskiella cystojenkinii]|nr:hypothetical protein BGZ83_010077 [Gryganskiella cystojenkinii]
MVTTNGPGPGDIHGHCMVEAYGGSKIVLFGGTTLNGPSVANIYTLDVNSMSWTKGPSGDSSQNREQMACSVSGDNFVTWGGQNWDTHTTTLVKTTGVFNMASSQWTSQYDARPASGPSSRPSPGSSSGSNTGAITAGYMNSPPALTTTEYPTTPFPAGNTPMYPTAWQVTPPVKGPNFQDPDEVK